MTGPFGLDPGHDAEVRDVQAAVDDPAGTNPVPVAPLRERLAEIIPVCGGTSSRKVDEMGHAETVDAVLAVVQTELDERDRWHGQALAYQDAMHKARAERDALQKQVDELKGIPLALRPRELTVAEAKELEELRMSAAEREALQAENERLKEQMADVRAGGEVSTTCVCHNEPHRVPVCPHCKWVGREKKDLQAQLSALQDKCKKLAMKWKKRANGEYVYRYLPEEALRDCADELREALK